MLDDTAAMVEAALHGAGLIYVGAWTVLDCVAAQRLTQVLEDWTPTYAPLCLYYPGHRLVPARRASAQAAVFGVLGTLPLDVGAQLPSSVREARSVKMAGTALVVGASGIVGSATAVLLKALGWTVHGLARRPVEQAGVAPIAADLQDASGTSVALAALRPDAVFITTWLRQDSEAENIKVNSAMVRNLLDALRPAGTVRHVALVTGLKHYLGPFEAYGKDRLPQTPFREDQGRLEVENFYYAQEDEVFAASARDGFTWTVHRPHTVIGKAVGNAMNMGTTLAVYATICRETGRLFFFPGSAAQWDGLTDMTDARLLAKHLLWATESPAAANEAFNVVNGDIFRWKWMWARIADWFGLEPAHFDGELRPLEEQMADDREIWRKIAEREGLAEPDLSRLASPWHTDADLGRPIEVVTDMSKSRRLGFTAYQPTDEAFFDLFARLRDDRLIP